MRLNRLPLLWGARHLAPLLLLLGIGAAGAAPHAKWTVTLPDSAAYSYWVQSKAGVVSVLPATVSHKQTFALPGSVHAGDTLFLLDAHSGQIAEHPLASPGPISVSVSDFKPLPIASAPATPVPKPAPSRAAAAPHKGIGDGIAVLFSWILGLIIAGVVVWFVLRLINTRGEPLIALARKAGIDVPDPTPLDPNAEVAPVYEPPKPRAIEKIPEEAGLAPATPPRRRSQPTRAPGSGGAPQLVGIEGLAAGSTFTLNGDAVMIGRDGDNEIVLAESTVSRRHARLERSAQGETLISDEGSANGIIINGERVQQAVLVHGDEIKIGDNYFRYEA